MLRVAQQSGLLESALQNLANQQPDEVPCESENSWHPVTPGTMADGSKRRMPSPTPSDERQMEGSALQKLPEDLWSRLDKLAVGHLPPGVTSMKMWSKTLISFGKFEAEKLSYWDLVISKDVEKSGYVRWIPSHMNEKSSDELKDLRDFIKIYQKEALGPNSGVVLFPGGKIRHFK